MKVKAPPEKGRANKDDVALLAERLGIAALSISVVSGHASLAKVVAVDGMDNDAILQAFSYEHREKQRFPKAGISVPPAWDSGAS